MESSALAPGAISSWRPGRQRAIPETQHLFHALRNDLALLVGSVEVLALEPDIPADSRGLSTVCSRAAERLEANLGRLQHLVAPVTCPDV
jgi:hypothetical protein